MGGLSTVSGILFYLGTTIAATMYVLGAVEAFQTGFGVKDVFTFDTQVSVSIETLVQARTYPARSSPWGSCL